jgi:RHS repeat-associated protein
LGRRIAKQRLAADGESVLEQVDFTWDGTTLCEQTTTSPSLPNPVTLTRDHQGLHPITQTERITAADAPQHEIDSRFFAIVTDLVGTPTELIDEQGEIAWRTRSTLWGTTAWAAGSTAYTPFRFPGQYFDPETGLHYNYFRHYDPEVARYVTSDPLGLSPAPNPAPYVLNPQTLSDHLGLAPEACSSSALSRKPSVDKGSFAVIGRKYDTEIAVGWDEHDALDLPQEKWSVEINDAWVQRVIFEGRDIYLATEPVPGNILDELGRQRVFGREIEQLEKAGYIRAGDYLLAPGR